MLSLLTANHTCRRSEDESWKWPSSTKITSGTPIVSNFEIILWQFISVRITFYSRKNKISSRNTKTFHNWVSVFVSSPWLFRLRSLRTPWPLRSYTFSSPQHPFNFITVLLYSNKKLHSNIDEFLTKFQSQIKTQNQFLLDRSHFHQDLCRHVNAFRGLNFLVSWVKTKLKLSLD